ncbi:nuclear transport factor 2 family protein [Flammeovirga agarivorans]|uniref:SnoaL-like domain-containing protein n=1 Tax=Flammeovirga agarivorans TaxID=2726742 RepID=A0A7X8XY34_9BACT|nr:nuclear transport factor 2 family protein [Flammeovirga agarivorans]NLR93665.1 SnoaL-like domain-containing protein [Flammeovirga agarivorans]
MDLTQNKENAIAFYRMAYEGNPKKAVDLYVGDQYIQHNPDVSDGLTGFIEYFERMQKEYPEKSIEFVRCIAEGNLVALHTHQTWPDDDQYVTMDFFRFDEKGKICEHWDAIQQIPKQSANDNTMY